MEGEFGIVSPFHPGCSIRDELLHDSIPGQRGVPPWRNDSVFSAGCNGDGADCQKK